MDSSDIIIYSPSSSGFFTNIGTNEVSLQIDGLQNPNNDMQWSNGTLILDKINFNIVISDGGSVQLGDFSPVSSSEPATSSSSSSSGSFGGSKVTSSDLNEGYEKLLGEGWKVKFKVDEDYYQVFLEKFIDNDTIELTFVEKEITFNISVGETQKIDYDNDSVSDLNIYFRGVSDSLAEIVLTFINEETIAHAFSVQSEKSLIDQKTNESEEDSGENSSLDYLSFFVNNYFEDFATYNAYSMFETFLFFKNFLSSPHFTGFSIRFTNFM